jgi:hypothetical protein
VPGTYTVKLELAGFQTITRENIVVLVGQTTPVELAMKLASLAENITVTGASPTVDTTSANVAVNLSEQLIQGTPGGRDIWALVEAKVPGLVMSRPDVGGTSGGLQGTFSARGTASAQNTSFLNGVNVGDPAAIGAAGFYYDFDAFDDIQVSTGAHDITVPTSGVFLNMVTKSGGENWHGRLTGAWLGDATQTQNIDDNLLRYGFRPQTNAVDYVSDRRQEAARVRVVPRLARARQRAGGVLDAGARPHRHHLGPCQRQLPVEQQQPADRPLLAAVLQEAAPLPQFVGDVGAGIDQQRRRRVRHLPGAVELGGDAEVLRRRARRAQQDLLSHLPERQRSDAARFGHQHPHP